MADIGTIQRLPKLIGNASLVRELVYTARKFTADEALKLGMVRWEIFIHHEIVLFLLFTTVYSNVYENQESAESAALSLANDIASKSPVAVQGSKVNLNYSRDHPVDTALDYAVREYTIIIQGFWQEKFIFLPPCLL